ncbi:MAG TPA: CHASE3 domain-containing protein [Hanamia sp.]
MANRTRVGFFAALFLLFLSYILTLISTREVEVQDFWINHTNEVIHNLDNIQGLITEAESSFRGYLLTNDNNLLKTYDKSLKKTDSTFEKLRLLMIDNKEQQNNMDTLHFLIDQKFLSIENAISEYAQTHKTLPKTLNENQLTISKTNAIAGELNTMKNAETTLWNQRAKSVSKYSGLIQVLNMISIIIAVILTFYSLIVYNKENKEKRKVSIKADQYKAQLQSRIKQLADLNTELIELRNLEKYAVTGRVARVIAHEVRNPLTNINLATEQLKSEIGETENTEMLFSMIKRNSERINQLVSDLLDTTRVSELKFSKASINDIIDESLSLALDRIELNRVQVIKHYDPEICPISVDIEKIKIAFLNIIVNGIEATGESGILEISTNKKDDKCVVKFNDNGIGMSKSDMDRLFEPYFTTKEKGNGLGLANTQNIILGHKGSISAESELGKGTVFTVSFVIPRDNDA